MEIEKFLEKENEIILDTNTYSSCEIIDFQYIKKLYLMYEFSDKVRLLDKSSQYGSLWNYVDAGILTEDEVRKVILM